MQTTQAAVPQAGVRADSRPSRTSPARLQGLAALGVYAAAWIGYCVRALVLHPGMPQLDQSSMDPNLFTWMLRWWPYAISHGLDPLRTSLIGVPAGFNLAWLTTVPPLALIVSPVTVLFGPVVSFNLLVVIAPPLAGWAAFVLCRRLTGRFWPALAGGAVYAFSAYEYNHSVPGHLDMTFSLLLPLMGYLTLLWHEGRIGRNAFIGLLTAGLLVQQFLFLETFADLTAMWAAGLVAGYLVARRSWRPEIARLSRYVGIAYLITFALSAPYLYYVVRNTPTGFVRTSPQNSALNLANMVVPRPSQTLGLSFLHQYSLSLASHFTVSESCYVGIPMLLLVVAAGVTTWSSRLTRFLVIMFVFAVLVSMGPDVQTGNLHELPLPWAELWKLPIARSAFPNRVMVFGFLALAVVLARWLASPAWQATWRWLLGVLAVAGILLDIAPIATATPTASAALPPFISTGLFRHYLTSGETVVVISTRGNAGLLWQAETDFYVRIAGGFVSQAISRHSDLPGPIQRLSDPSPAIYRQAAAFLRQAHVGAILVEGDKQVRWTGSLDHLGLRGQSVGGVIIFRVNRPAAATAAT
ncbi:MAG TPA: hypothetical protein VEL03_22275 [Streptosporangiaceae bacterium]|nr:hypothetical protein [Streptosporangiaceae bacterium]